jgi:hypothetical protein
VKRAIPYVILLTCGCSLVDVAGTGSMPMDGGRGVSRIDGGESSSPPEDAQTARDAAVGHRSDASHARDSAVPQPGPQDAGEISETDAANPRDSGPLSPSFTPGPGEVGAPCEQTSECKGLNASCIRSVDAKSGTVTVPNGYCTHTCNLLPCGKDEKCVDNIEGINTKLCVRACEDDSDCRAAEGYVCHDKQCTLPGL